MEKQAGAESRRGGVSKKRVVDAVSAFDFVV
jgi:hypothetical protein